MAATPRKSIQVDDEIWQVFHAVCQRTWGLSRVARLQQLIAEDIAEHGTEHEIAVLHQVTVQRGSVRGRGRPRILTARERDAVRTLHADGDSVQELARAYNVPQAQITEVLKG